MAASPKAKRKKGEILNSYTNSVLVDNFLTWCKDVGLSISKKVTVRENGSCHRFGMVAIDELEEGECLFKIPRNILLEPSTTSISNILAELNNHSKNDTERHKWLPLLVTLLYEYTNPSSKWRPYLDLVPSETVLNQPIFWSEEEKESLELIEIKENVNSDIKQIEEQYNDIVLPFIKANCKFFDPKVHTLELYKRLSGFVMAYSFTDSGPNRDTPEIAMVPMADILNHVSDHNAELEFGEKYLSMVTIQPIEKGYEVFNTYGNLNDCSLLRCYGFIENCPNPYDIVEIPMKVFQQVLNITDDDWQTKLSHLKEELPDWCDEGLMFDRNGCLGSLDDFFTIFRIIHKEGNVDSDEEDENVVYFEPNNKTVEDCMNDVTILVEQLQEVIDQNSTTVDVEETQSSSSNEDDEGYDLDNEDTFSGNFVDDIQIYEELICLEEKWRETLSRAAKFCSSKITTQLKKLSDAPNFDEKLKRREMVKEILQGRLSILKRVEDLHKAELA